MPASGYDALVFVNFSATCAKQGNAAELIVEFPSALMLLSGSSDGSDAAAPAISHESRVVIRPRDGRTDAARLARLGIAHVEVENGDTLPEAVQQVRAARSRT
jgi:predicted Fe-Mo cluster-binding NifX family protein